MPFNLSNTLWPTADESFFRDRVVTPRAQQGPHCVSTVLAMLTDQTPESFQGRVNTQDPVSWSNALSEHGLKLAYCPTDIRRIRYYLPELLRLDDLFTISYYSPVNSSILDDPDDRGWVCGSHIVILHRSQIIDPSGGRATEALSHHCGDHFTKRIFRVVPQSCSRGL